MMAARFPGMASSDAAKEPFDIRRAVQAIREAIRPYPKAALFELYEDDGFRSAFEQLVACILSIRTYDASSAARARRPRWRRWTREPSMSSSQT